MRIAFVATLLVLGSSCFAQDHAGHSAQSAGISASSTAGYSAEERAAGLREGRGMGLAIPAEENFYDFEIPGSRHTGERR